MADLEASLGLLAHSPVFHLGITETPLKEGSPDLPPRPGKCPFKDTSSQPLGFFQLQLVLG